MISNQTIAYLCNIVHDNVFFFHVHEFEPQKARDPGKLQKYISWYFKMVYCYSVMSSDYLRGQNSLLRKPCFYSILWILFLITEETADLCCVAGRWECLPLFAQSNSDAPQTQSICHRYVELHGACFHSHPLRGSCWLKYGRITASEKSGYSACVSRANFFRNTNTNVSTISSETPGEAFGRHPCGPGLTRFFLANFFSWLYPAALITWCLSTWSLGSTERWARASMGNHAGITALTENDEFAHK